MRHRYMGGAVLAAVVAVGWPTAAAAPDQGQFQPPVNSYPVIPLPTGQTGQRGFYTSGEFVMLFQTKALGQQTIARRGFFDSDGLITGTPGTFIGSGNPALSTNQLGSGGTGMPGFRVEVGYKFDTGVRIYANYMQVYDAHYSAGATGAAPLGFRGRADLSDTFLTSPVYNFTNAFGGPRSDVTSDITAVRTFFQVGNTIFSTLTPPQGFNAFGIWNAADAMDVKFTQRFQQAEVG